MKHNVIFEYDYEYEYVIMNMHFFFFFHISQKVSQDFNKIMEKLYYVDLSYFEIC